MKGLTERLRGCRYCSSQLPVPRPSSVRSCDRCKRERSATTKRRWYEANKSAAAMSAAEWKRRNPEKVRESTRRRYERVAAQHREVTDAWRQRNPEKVRDIREARRARERDAFVEFIDRRLVWVAFGGRCGICTEPVWLSEMHLDHVWRGGLHAYSNVQPAHETCNKRKHNALPAKDVVIV